MELLVLNTDFESVRIIDNFKSLIWTDRYGEYGDFELCLAISDDLLRHLKLGNYLWLKESEHQMIIESLSIDSDAEDGDQLMIKGRSLESILTRRIVWGQKSYSGNFQNAIKNMLTEAFISPIISDRRISNFVFEESTDPQIAKLTVNVQFTGDNLYDSIVGLCKEHRIGFKVVLDDQNRFVFSLYSGKDRSYGQSENPYVVFSPKFENIINSNYYATNENLKTVTFVAGEGEGSSRKSAVVGGGSGLERRELFTDARDISSTTETGTLSDDQYIAKLQTRGKKNLAEYAAGTVFDGEAEATRLFKYGKDFFIGDIIQIANEYGHESAAYISELIMSQNEMGTSIYPTFKIL